MELRDKNRGFLQRLNVQQACKYKAFDCSLCGHASIEGFWSLLKRGIIGIYHFVSRKHLQDYVDEFVFRYNTRKSTEAERINHLLSNMCVRTTYRGLIHG